MSFFVSCIFLILFLFRPHNFPAPNPVGAALYDMVLDIARVYLLYGPHSRDIFQARDKKGSYM